MKQQTPARTNKLVRRIFLPVTVLLFAYLAHADEKYTIWSACVSGTTGNINKIAVKDSVSIVGICSNGDVIQSSDGITWSRVYTSSVPPTDLTVSPDGFASCADTNYITSTDGKLWTVSKFYGNRPDVGVSICGVTYGKYFMVAGGSSMVLCSNYLPNTPRWVPLYLGVIQSHFCKMFSVDTAIVGFGSGGQILYIYRLMPESGEPVFSYQPVSSSVTQSFSDFSYNSFNKTYYGITPVGSDHYRIYSSKNLNTWTLIDSGAGNVDRIVFYGNSSFAIGLSTNGVLPVMDSTGAWHRDTLAGASVINDIAYGDSIYVAVGNGGKVFLLKNGTSWAACSSKTTRDLLKVT